MESAHEHSVTIDCSIVVIEAATGAEPVSEQRQDAVMSQQARVVARLAKIYGLQTLR